MDGECGEGNRPLLHSPAENQTNGAAAAATLDGYIHFPCSMMLHLDLRTSAIDFAGARPRDATRGFHQPRRTIVFLHSIEKPRK